MRVTREAVWTWRTIIALTALLLIWATPHAINLFQMIRGDIVAVLKGE